MLVIARGEAHRSDSEQLDAADQRASDDEETDASGQQRHNGRTEDGTARPAERFIEEMHIAVDGQHGNGLSILVLDRRMRGNPSSLGVAIERSRDWTSSAKDSIDEGR